MPINLLCKGKKINSQFTLNAKGNIYLLSPPRVMRFALLTWPSPTFSLNLLKLKYYDEDDEVKEL